MKTIRVYTTDVSQDLYLKASDPLSFSQDTDGPGENENSNFIIYPDVTYQTIKGFGGALTEAAAYNFSLLSPKDQETFLRSYFDETRGIGYNLIRLTINSSDFARETYSYDDTPDDYHLEHFSMEHEEKWLFPLLRRILRWKPALQIVASPWSPPAWMKTTGRMDKGGKLRPECRKVWAEYYVRYLTCMKEHGFPVFAITVQNEPNAEQGWESCLFTAEEERVFAVNFLRPALDAAGFSDVKILFWDHNKERVVSRAAKVMKDPESRAAISGIAVHWYSGDHFEALSVFHELYPDKMILGTEASCSAHRGTTENGEAYAHDIIGDLNHFANGWIDWNMLLDETGRPYHWKDEQLDFKRAYGSGAIKEEDLDPIDRKFMMRTLNCRPWTGESPLSLDENCDLLVQSSMSYLGHFSRFIERGAVRIASSIYTASLEGTAFRNPDGTTVIVILNRTEHDLPLTLRLGLLIAETKMEAHTIKTFVF